MRIVAGEPAHPRSIFGRNEPGERRAVMEGGHRRKTSPADGGHAAAFRLDAPPGLCMVERQHQLFLPTTHLQRERSLARLGQQLLGSEMPVDLRAATKSVETTRGEDDRVQSTFAALAQ